MTININPDDVKLFEENGFTKEQVGATVNHYREQGLSDDDIQLRMNDKLNQFRNKTDDVMNTPLVEDIQLNEDGTRKKVLQGSVRKNIDLTPSGLAKGVALNGLSALGAPLYAIANKKSLPQAFNDVKNQYIESEAAFNDKYPEYKKSQDRRDRAFDFGVYALLPGSKGGGLAKQALNTAAQGGLIAGAESTKNNGLGTQNLVDAGIGVGIGGALPPVFRGSGMIAGKIANNPAVQNFTGKTLEALTSVPKKYIDRALKAELGGKSILGGKFNPETAYQPVEQKLRQALNMLPSKETYAKRYSDLAKRAKEGIDKKLLEKNVELNTVIKNMPESASDISALRESIDEGLNKFQFGDVNPALEEAGGVINNAKRQLGFGDNTNSKVSPATLHGIKEQLYDRANFNGDMFGNYGNSGIKSVAQDINQYLRNQNPAYAGINDELKLLNSVKYDLGGPAGINQNTLAGKLKGIGSEANTLSNMDDRLRNLNTLLDDEYKFYNDAANLAKTQNAQKELEQLVGGRQLQRNPRLLGNINDIARQQALEDLQAQTGVNFMDELENIQAREALDRLFPGQGGGSGSAQGFGNLLRTSIIGGAPTAAAITHNPIALAGLGLISPKITGQGTIRAFGALNNLGNMEVNPGLYNLLLQGVGRTVGGEK